MYWWNIKRLKDALVERPLTAREQLSYYIATWMLISGIAALAALAPSRSTPVVIVEIVVGTIFMILGSFYFYRCNGGAAGKELLPRMFSIGWVMTIRWSVLAIPLIMLIGFIVVVFAGLMGLAGPDPTENALEPLFSTVYSALYYLFLVIFFWRCGVHLRDVAVRSAEPTATD